MNNSFEMSSLCLIHIFQTLTTAEGKRVRVIVDVSQSSMPSNDLSPHLLGQKDEASQFVVGQLSVLSGMTWAAFDQAIGSVLANSCKVLNHYFLSFSVVAGN